MTLADLLSDLRYVAHVYGSAIRAASEIDVYGAALVELGWCERIGTRSLRVTLDGLDVLHACCDVPPQEAA